jgi:hypothetical protein
MKSKVLILLIIIFHGLISYGQIILNGVLITDENQPVPYTRISTAGGQSDLTDSKGQFSIHLSVDFIEGESVILLVDKRDWIINYPLDGRWNLPNIELQQVQTTKVIIVPKGSKALWSNARIENCIKEMSDKIAKLRLEQLNTQTTPIDFAYYLDEWAEKYGFTKNQVKEFFDEWADKTSNTKDKHVLGLNEFYKKNFSKAATYFEDAAIEDEIKMKNINEEYNKKRFRAYDNWMLSGDMLSNEEKYEDALLKYENAYNLLDKNDSISKWAITKWVLANTKKLITGQTSTNSLQYLLNSIKDYEEIINAFTDYENPTFKAMINVSLAEAYLAHSFNYSDSISYRSAIELIIETANIINRKKIKDEKIKAKIEYKLGNLFYEFGKEGADELKIDSYNNAVIALNNALNFFTLEKYPSTWGNIQNKLSEIVQLKAGSALDSESVSLYHQAINHSNAALTVFTRINDPCNWANSQYHLGRCYSELIGFDTTSYSNANAAFLASSQVYTLKQYPQDWARIQKQMAGAFYNLSKMEQGEKKKALLYSSIALFDSALFVFKQKEFPAEWATIQNNLGSVYEKLAEENDGEQSVKLYLESLDAYNAALTIRKKDIFPRDWALTQSNIGDTYKSLSNLIPETERYNILQRAENAYNLALTVYNKKYSPKEYAENQKDLAVIFTGKWAYSSVGVVADEWLRLAINKYKDALTIFKPETSFESYRIIQMNLAQIYDYFGNYIEESNCYLNLLLIEPDNEYCYRSICQVFHENLFEYSKALELHKKWINIHPSDISTKCEMVENLFTTGHYLESEDLYFKIIGSDKISSYVRIALKSIQIANCIAQNKNIQIDERLNDLINDIRIESDTFQVGWNFKGTTHYINSNAELQYYNEWLMDFFKIIESTKGKEEMTKSLALIKKQWNLLNKNEIK